MADKFRVAMWLAACAVATSAISTGCTADGDSKKCEVATTKLESKEYEQETRKAIDDSGKLPSGYCVYNVSINKNDKSGMLGVNVYLSVDDSQGKLDDLRPAATEVAHVVKKMPYNSPVSELYVSNLTPQNSSKDYAGIIAKEFYKAPWDGSPSREAELAAWVPWTAHG
ncbi:hypothetical protein ACIO14_26375 [Nocardia fluminea]|uniref:hypothetical protein n=1 Tax=Nocardia fluminea TaxID=134984 RepID=UPI003827ACDB